MAPSNIKICVRIRPEQGTERSSQFREIVKSIGDKIVIFDPPQSEDGGLKKIFTSQRNKDLKFSFDNVFGPESSQLDVYRCTTANVLDDVLNGFNSCVFAYGATGAGKTFTMLGNKENPGVIYKTVMMLYTKIDAMSDQYTYDLDVSYVEIYNENIKDLLSPGGKIILNEDSHGTIQLKGVTLHHPKSADELLEMLLKGNNERTQSSTAANSESSRSHAIFQIYLRGRPKVTGTTATWKHSKFSLIDLAGSEKGSVTRTTKQKSEGSNINRSLLALGNVINALADRKKNPKIFIPYRDSKLTRLLKDSLGGSCKTIMIANLSPSSKNYEDTYNTLKYANRAKNIKVELVDNVVQVKRHVGEYGQLVSDLKAEVASLTKKLDEKNHTAEKIKLMEEFNQAHKMFDMKCREVFQERAQLKKDLTIIEAEEHNLSSEIKQNELYTRVIGKNDANSLLLGLIEVEKNRLSDMKMSAKLKVQEKKADIAENMARANKVQQEIHEYIQHNSAEIPKPLGPELLVQLWEYHLVKVQSYFTQNAVSVLQETVTISNNIVTHVNNITEQLFGIISDNENIPETVTEKIRELCAELMEGPPEKKKKGGIVWADDKASDFPTSHLFPSPQLVQPQSPTLSFTPGKIPVGSTPQLNKLQAAHVHGEAFATPATKLQACFNDRFSMDGGDTKRNLIEKFNIVNRKAYKPILKEVSNLKTCINMEDQEKKNELNSTFTFDEPTVIDHAGKFSEITRDLSRASSIRGSKRKMSLLPQPSSRLYISKRKAAGTTQLKSPGPPMKLLPRSVSPGPPKKLVKSGPTRASSPGTSSTRASRPASRTKMQPRSLSAPRIDAETRARNVSSSAKINPKNGANGGNKTKNNSIQKSWKS